MIIRQIAALTLLAGLLFLYATPAHAQYVIGEYSYTCPIGSQWNDPRCIREYIGPDNQVGAPRQRRWRETWGAISFDSGTGHYGATINKRTKAEASRIAETRCGLEGSMNCSSAFAYLNQCAVLAFPTVGTGSIVAMSGPDTSIISEKAVRECRNSGPKECKIVYEDCSRPILE